MAISYEDNQINLYQIHEALKPVDEVLPVVTKFGFTISKLALTCKKNHDCNELRLAVMAFEDEFISYSVVGKCPECKDYVMCPVTKVDSEFRVTELGSGRQGIMVFEKLEDDV